LKSVKIWQNYGDESVARFFWSTIYMTANGYATTYSQSPFDLLRIKLYNRSIADKKWKKNSATSGVLEVTADNVNTSTSPKTSPQLIYMYNISTYPQQMYVFGF